MKTILVHLNIFTLIDLYLFMFKLLNYFVFPKDPTIFFDNQLFQESQINLIIGLHSSSLNFLHDDYQKP